MGLSRTRIRADTFSKGIKPLFHITLFEFALWIESNHTRGKNYSGTSFDWYKTNSSDILNGLASFEEENTDELLTFK